MMGRSWEIRRLVCCAICVASSRRRRKEELRYPLPPIRQHRNQAADVVDVIGFDNEDGYLDPLSPINVRERRVANARKVLGFKAQHGRGDQADQAAA